MTTHYNTVADARRLVNDTKTTRVFVFVDWAFDYFQVDKHRMVYCLNHLPDSMELASYTGKAASPTGGLTVYLGYKEAFKELTEGL